jgi:hypothetical protein
MKYTLPEHSLIADVSRVLLAADDPANKGECEALLAIAGFSKLVWDTLGHRAMTYEQIRRSIFNMGERHAKEVGQGRARVSIVAHQETPACGNDYRTTRT